MIIDMIEYVNRKAGNITWRPLNRYENQLVKALLKQRKQHPQASEAKDE